MMPASSTITDEVRAKFEADNLAREQRSEYGRTVGDLRRLLKNVDQVQVAVRTGSIDSIHDVNFPFVTSDAALTMFRHMGDDEFTACEFDPVEKTLCVGSRRSIRKAQESA